MRAEKILRIAASEIGYTENPPNSNRTKYGKAYCWDGVPWCCIFVWWCFSQAHAQGLFYGGNKTASCPQYMAWSMSRGRWVTSGFKPGDIVLFNFDGKPDADHIGIIESVEKDGIYSIEGNTSSDSSGSQSNGGGVFRKFREWKEIMGADRPPYEEDEMTQAEFDKMLENYLERQAEKQIPSWAAEEYQEAIDAGITDGTRPQAFIPRYQAAIMALRAKGK